MASKNTLKNKRNWAFEMTEEADYFKYEDVKEAVNKFERYIMLFEKYSIGSYCPLKFKKEFGEYSNDPKYIFKKIFGDFEK